MDLTWEIDYEGIRKTPQQLLEYIRPNIRPEDMEVMQIAFKHKGVLFGGAIRDLYTGQKIEDFDFLFPTDEQILAFHSELQHFFAWKYIGYHYWKAKKTNGVECMRGLVDPQKRTVGVPSFDAFSQKTFDKKIAPIADFDCNLLTFDGEKLGFLAEGKTFLGVMLSLEEAVLHLINFQAFPISSYPLYGYDSETDEVNYSDVSRVVYMRTKGFELLVGALGR